jgi:hypothetical protein
MEHLVHSDLVRCTTSKKKVPQVPAFVLRMPERFWAPVVTSSSVATDTDDAVVPTTEDGSLARSSCDEDRVLDSDDWRQPWNLLTAIDHETTIEDSSVCKFSLTSEGRVAGNTEDMDRALNRCRFYTRANANMIRRCSHFIEFVQEVVSVCSHKVFTARIMTELGTAETDWKPMIRGLGALLPKVESIDSLLPDEKVTAMLSADGLVKNTVKRSVARNIVETSRSFLMRQGDVEKIVDWVRVEWTMKKMHRNDDKLCSTLATLKVLSSLTDRCPKALSDTLDEMASQVIMSFANLDDIIGCIDDKVTPRSLTMIACFEAAWLFSAGVPGIGRSVVNSWLSRMTDGEKKRTTIAELDCPENTEVVGTAAAVATVEGNEVDDCWVKVNDERTKRSKRAKAKKQKVGVKKNGKRRK